MPSSVTAAEGPKLVFYMGSERLGPGTTVFQAIQQMQLGTSAPAAEHDEGDEDAGAQPGQGRRLWDTIYTLHYRSAEGVEAEASGSGRGKGAEASGQGHDASQRYAHAPLQEVMSTALPADISANGPCREVLQLLQVRCWVCARH